MKICEIIPSAMRASIIILTLLPGALCLRKAQRLSDLSEATQQFHG